MQYENVLAPIARAMSAGMSLRDLQEFYSVEDVHDFMEIKAVDAHNARRLHESAAGGA